MNDGQEAAMGMAIADAIVEMLEPRFPDSTTMRRVYAAIRTLAWQQDAARRLHELDGDSDTAE